MRSKEEAHDYRYFPDPDLIPVVIDDAWLEQIEQSLPELPEQKRARFIDEFGLPAYDAEIITSSRELAEYFETAEKIFPQPKKISNWMMTELMREMKGEDGINISQCPVSPENLAELLVMIDKGAISGKIGKTVFSDMMESGKNPQTIVKEKNLVQMSDEGDLLKIIREIMADNPAQVTQFKEGKTKVMGFFVGQLMKKTRGKANPKLANQLFAKELK
jgi:aspartyl-tRNA(Asn)/glutamyl-tRNA(Gln) amidotransferase subunit B